MPNAIDLQPLFDAIVADYARFNENSLRALGAGYGYPDRVAERTEAFRSKLSATVGAKYIRIVSGGSAWGFVVNVDDDKKFARGDILKCAGWSTPARNRARGNVLTGDLSWVRWTGPEYLR